MAIVFILLATVLLIGFALGFFYGDRIVMRQIRREQKKEDRGY